MRKNACVGQVYALSRFALIGLFGGLAAACSSDTIRFSESPFSNPFSTNSAGSVAATAPDRNSEPMAVAAVPMSQVQSQALPPVQSQPLPPVTSQPSYARAHPAPSAPAATGPGGWTAEGGTRITLGAGDTLNTVASRYGVPASAILAANGLPSAAHVGPGRQIVIPVYSAIGAPANSVASAAPAQSQPKFRLVAGAKPAQKESADERASPPVRPTQAALVRKPETTQPQQAPARTAQTASVPPVAAKPTAPQKVASAEALPVSQPVVEKPAPAPAAPVETAKPAPAKEPEQTASLPAEPTTDFRWPARGRVIAGFGANGGNEGINIALPEGTPVKAAEAGVVTYAGSEVKGYGNLVLIKHDNGYISAYAHNGELNVKRGDRVKRGQVIAKSGQTGNVTSPQLHFEIRKGQVPVDPMAHLSGG